MIRTQGIKFMATFKIQDSKWTFEVAPKKFMIVHNIDFFHKWTH